MATEEPLAALARTTLEEVEGDRWPDADPDDSYLIRTCTALRKVPLGDLDAEDMRIMIGQEIGLDVLVPLAVGVVSRDPWAEGDFGPGDLLRAVLRVRADWYAAHPAVADALRNVAHAIDLDAQDPLDVPEGLADLVAEWRSRG